MKNGCFRNLKGFFKQPPKLEIFCVVCTSSEYRIIEDTLGNSILNLTVAKGYVTKLMDNAKVVRYFLQNYPEIPEEFQKITEMKSINIKDSMEETV